MTQLKWDQIGDKVYETGTDHGVLFLPNTQGVYDTGVAWNGLTAVTESPSGAESNKQYADNRVYANLVSAEEFSGTIEAFTYPDEFAECNGEAELTPGVFIGQQTRRSFGFSWRTKIGNDTVGQDFGYKLHLVYGALAAPSEKNYTTVNDSPEAMALSWEMSTTPVEVGTDGGKTYKPTATLTIDSTKVDATALAQLEQILYGTAGSDPRLPLPAEVYGMFETTLTEVAPVAPTYDAGTDTITIPAVTGVVYTIDDLEVSGAVTITDDTVVEAHPAPGYVFPAVTDTDWLIVYS